MESKELLEIFGDMLKNAKVYVKKPMNNKNPNAWLQMFIVSLCQINRLDRILRVVLK